MKKEAILIMLVLLSVSVTAVGVPNMQVSLLNQDPDPAKAGDVVEVRIRLQNIGDAEATDLWIEAMPEYPFTLISGEEERQVIPSLPQFPEREASKTIEFKLRIDREAVEGQYELKIQYSLSQGTGWVEKDFNIDITSREFAEIFYIDKRKLMPGEETEMTFTINNLGYAPLQNMVFFWEEPDGIVLPVGTDNTRYIKYLEPGESVDLKYTVVASVSANPDLYTLNLNLEYDGRDEDGNRIKETVTTTAGVFVGGKTDFDVTFSESSQGQTSLSVSNIGSNPALSVTVRVPEQEGVRVMGSRDAIVGNLDKGDYTVVSFQLMPSSGFNGARGGELSEEERQRMRQQFQRGNTVQVIIDYTDTTGIRQSVEKTVPVQFRAPTEGQQNGQPGHQFGGGPGGFRRQSWWQKPGIIIPFVIVVLVIGGFIFYRKWRGRKRRK